MSAIMEKKRGRRRITCPRCKGTRQHEFADGYFEGCRACGSTGRLTIAAWNAWCDALNSSPTLASQLGKRCPDCSCGATEQDYKQRCPWHAIGLGLSLSAPHTEGRDPSAL